MTPLEMKFVIGLLILVAVLMLAFVVDRGIPNLLEAVGIRLIRVATAIRRRRNRIQGEQRVVLQQTQTEAASC